MNYKQRKERKKKLKENYPFDFDFMKILGNFLTWG